MSVSVSVEPLSCTAKITVTSTEQEEVYLPCRIIKNGVQRGFWWAYTLWVDFTRTPLTITLPLFPLSPATNYTLKCDRPPGYEFEVSFTTHDIPTAGAYSVDGTLTDVEKELNARYINRIMSDNDNWSLNAICVMIGLLDSYGGLNPLYMWENSGDDFTGYYPCILKYPWINAPAFPHNIGRQPWQSYDITGIPWYAWLLAIGGTDETKIRKTTFGGFPYSKALFWSTMFQLKDLGLYDYDWYYDDKAMSIENIALILKHMYRFPTLDAFKAGYWNGSYSFKTSTQNTDDLVDIAYNKLEFSNYSFFSPFRDNYTWKEEVDYCYLAYRDTIDIDLWKDRAKYWYNKLKPKPPHKKHKMPIWEYLRYTI